MPPSAAGSSDRCAGEPAHGRVSDPRLSRSRHVPTSVDARPRPARSRVSPRSSTRLIGRLVRRLHDAPGDQALDGMGLPVPDLGLDDGAVRGEQARASRPDRARPLGRPGGKRRRSERERLRLSAAHARATGRLEGAEVGQVLFGQVRGEVTGERERVLGRAGEHSRSGEVPARSQ
jgi:hypothetical protein